MRMRTWRWTWMCYRLLWDGGWSRWDVGTAGEAAWCLTPMVPMDADMEVGWLGSGQARMGFVDRYCAGW